MSKAALERAREHVDPHWDHRKVERQLSALEARVNKKLFHQRLMFGSLAFAGAAAAVLLATHMREPEPVAQRTPVAPSVQVAQAPKAVEATPAAPVAEGPLAPAVAPVEAEDPMLAALPAEDDAGADEAPSRRRGKHKKARRHATGTRLVMAGQAWRSLAREGRYQEAYIELAQAQLDRSASDVDDLLLAGDASRLSGHPREAVPYYRDALARAGTSSRAHLVAFTLGRTLLRELGDARGAAQSFARAYNLAPHGQLAEEALAGEVESWARAGEHGRAQDAGKRYLQAFPQGRRANDVRRLADLP